VVSPAVPGPAADAAPYDLPGGPDAALLLHGLSGSPFEVRPVAEHLNGMGLRCRAPVLPGHGGDPRALEGVPWRAWVDGARDELLRLGGARRTLVVGCSMGALAALVLAHEHPDRVDALALLAPALELALLPRLLGCLGRTGWAAWLPLLPKGASDVRDEEMRRRNPCMTAIPARAVGELLRMQEQVVRLLPAVAAPVLVVAGAQDHTVTLRGARRLAREVGSGPARLVVLPDSFHLVGIDVERDVAADEVERFMRSIPARRVEA